jgi:cytochrome P450
LYEISPEELSLLQTEILSLPAGPIPEQAISSLPVLDAFMKEALRKYTPVAATIKEILQPSEVNGTHLPAGTLLTIPLSANHYNEEMFPDPTEFRLTRFFKESADKKYPMGFLPFSIGSRMCLGMNLAKLEVTC